MVTGVVLVTGASGFIGVELVKQLEASGYRVISAGAGASVLSEQFRSTMREERRKFQEEIRVCFFPWV